MFFCSCWPCDWLMIIKWIILANMQLILQEKKPWQHKTVEKNSLINRKLNKPKKKPQLKKSDKNKTPTHKHSSTRKKVKHTNKKETNKNFKTDNKAKNKQTIVKQPNKETKQQNIQQKKIMPWHGNKTTKDSITIFNKKEKHKNKMGNIQTNQ